MKYNILIRDFDNFDKIDFIIEIIYIIIVINTERYNKIKLK